MDSPERPLEEAAHADPERKSPREKPEVPSNGGSTSVSDLDDYKVSESTDQFEFPQGIPHGYRIYVQLDDDNALYDLADEQLDEFTAARGTDTVTSDEPAAVRRWNAPWVDSEESQEIGRFADPDAYGTWDDGEYTQLAAQRFNLYTDVARGTDGIAQNAESVRVGLHPRRSEFRTEKNNDFTWPCRRGSGEQVEGTCIEVQTSYRHPLESWRQAKRLILEGFSDDENRQKQARALLDGDRLVLWDTFRITGQECHARHRRETKHPAVHTLKQTASLVATGDGSGREHGRYEQGEYLDYRFSTTNISKLGFDPVVEYTTQSDGQTEKRTCEIPGIYVKTYLHKHADNCGESSPYYHPKTEVRLTGGAVPLEAFDAVNERLSEYLNCFLHWAGVEEDDLVADDRYDPQTQPRQTVTAPTGYVYDLIRWLSSDELRNSVIGVLTKSCKNLHDILLVVRQRDVGVTYAELAEETGYSKETCRKYVGRLANEYGIVERVHSSEGTRTFIVDAAKEIVESAVDTARSEKDRLKGLAKRKMKRTKKRLRSRFDEKKEEVRDRERGSSDDGNEEWSEEVLEEAERTGQSPEYCAKYLAHQANGQELDGDPGFSTASTPGASHSDD